MLFQYFTSLETNQTWRKNAISAQIRENKKPENKKLTILSL